MNALRSSETPAILPALFLAGGIALAPQLVNARDSAITFAAVAVLLIPLRRIAFAMTTLSLAAGLFIGWREQLDEDRFLKLEDREEFATVEVPLHGTWTRGESGFRLNAPKFKTGGITVDRSLTVYTSSVPAAAGVSERLVIEGFLSRREDGSFQLVCKSARLMTYRGTASPLHPRYWNRRADDALTRVGSGRPHLIRSISLAKAVALGRSGELPSEVREDYRRGGTYHLLVFSGMQIAFAAAAIAFLLRGRSPGTRDVSLLLLALIAPLFVGDEPSVARASLMIGIFSATRLLKRPTPIENLFFVSAAVRLMFEPGELNDPGFALTYGATGGLLFIGRPLARGASHRITAAALYSFGAEIATLPLTLHFFHQYVIGGSIVTLLLAPILAAMFFAATAAACAALLSSDLAAAALHLISFFDSLATAVNRFCGDGLNLARVGAAPGAWLVITVFIVAILLLSRRAGRPVTFCALLLLPFLASVASTHFKSHVESPQIEFLDVGQGDAILIRAERLKILVDTGGHRGDSEFARRTLLPKLLDRGVTSLDAIVITHPHPDHCGALAPLIETITVGEIWIAAAHLKESCVADGANAAFRRRITVRLVRENQEVRNGSIQLALLPAERPFKRAALNNSSLVALLHLNGGRFLLTGDIERERELSLADESLRATVLKIAHHGSRSSTTEVLLNAVRPAIAVLSCGQRNPFGHPHPAVMERLRQAGVRIWRTDHNGDVKIRTDRGLLFVTPQIDTPRSPP